MNFSEVGNNVREAAQNETVTSQLLEAIKGLSSDIINEAPLAEENCSYSADINDALRQMGLYRVFRPASLGGFELDPINGFRVFEALAAVDGSLGWNVGNSNGVELFGAWLEATGAQKIFGDSDTVGCGAWNPPYKAVPMNGGYRLSGHTFYNSNCQWANWVIGLATIEENGQPRLNGDGMHETLIVFFRREEAEIRENWNVMGLCATGSHDLAVDNVFVPSDQTALAIKLESANHLYDGPFASLSTNPVLGKFAAVAIGIAQAALDDLIELGLKVPAYAVQPLKERSGFQEKVAQAAGIVHAARAGLYTSFNDAWSAAQRGEKLMLADKAKLQLVSTHAVAEAARAVSLIHSAIGASGIRKQSRFQKYFRDINVLTQQAYISAARYQNVGEVMLDVPPTWAFIDF
jgi:alkylation response protein AidB-like acyl-CoA dehydrogenase